VVGIVLACAAQATWILTSGSLQLYGAGRRVPLPERIQTSSGLTDDRLRQMVGWFGWLDTPPPLAVHLAWAAALLVLLGLALRRAPARPVALVALLAVAVLAVPVILEARSISEVGYFWQGRYTLPLAVGPATARRREQPRPRAGRWGPARAPRSPGRLPPGQLRRRARSVHRRQGAGTRPGDGQWAPPLPALVLVVGLRPDAGVVGGLAGSARAEVGTGVRPRPRLGPRQDGCAGR
jgi:hypothetical protein